MVTRILLIFGLFGLLVGCADDETPALIEEPISYIDEDTTSEYVRVHALRVRAGPNMAYDTLRYLQFNDSVKTLETSGSWNRIGEAEWVHGYYLTTQQLDEPQKP